MHMNVRLNGPNPSGNTAPVTGHTTGGHVMKSLVLAAVAAAGLLGTAGTADAQIFRNRGGSSSGYYSYPSYSYPSYGYSTYSYPSYGYSSYSYPTYSSVTPTYYNNGIVTSGYTPVETTGTIVTSGYTPVDPSGAVITSGGIPYSSPTVGSNYYSPTYTYPSMYYPSTYDGGYSYPMYYSGSSSRGLFGRRR